MRLCPASHFETVAFYKLQGRAHTTTGKISVGFFPPRRYCLFSTVLYHFLMTQALLLIWIMVIGVICAQKGKV